MSSPRRLIPLFINSLRDFIHFLGTLVVLRFLGPDSGQVLVAGNDITNWTEEQLTEIRRHVTMVFQSGALFDSLTVAENIAFPLETRTDMTEEQKDARVAELAEMLEVTDVVDQ